jgi:hypothetical protein
LKYKIFLLSYIFFFFIFSFKCISAAQNTFSTINLTIGEIFSENSSVKSFLGVISGPIQPPESGIHDISEHLKDIGVTTIRNNDYFDDRMDIEGIFNCGGDTYPSWEGCDAEDDSYYNWGPSDELFQSWVDGGFEPFLRLGGEVQNASKHHDFKGPQNTTQEDNWIIAAQKVVDRYLNWNGVENTFTYLDIWTEFPSDSFWDRSNSDFFSFWIKVFQTFKKEYPQLKIGGPGFIAGQAMKVVSGEDSVAEQFLEFLYENNVKPDWIGWHLFYNSPETFYGVAQAYYELLHGTGMFSDVSWAGTGFFDDVELIVDAYGISAMNASVDEIDAVYNKSLGAAYRTGAWIALQYSPVTKAFLYRAGDPSTTPNSPIEINGNYTGLFYGDSTGTYKPAAYAFKLWSKVVNGYSTLLTTSSFSESREVWYLAAKNSQGEIGILITNISKKDVQYSISFDNGTSTESYRITYFQVDNTDNGETVHSFANNTMTIPAETVQLVVLTPKPSIEAKFNKDTYDLSDELIFSVEVDNVSSNIDLYVAIVLEDGTFFTIGDSFILSELNELVPFLTDVSESKSINIFDVEITEDIAAGEYIGCALATESDSDPSNTENWLNYNCSTIKIEN